MSRINSSSYQLLSDLNIIIRRAVGSGAKRSYRALYKGARFELTAVDGTAIEGKFA
jgi:hypothetical protein